MGVSCYLKIPLIYTQPFTLRWHGEFDVVGTLIKHVHCLITRSLRFTQAFSLANRSDFLEHLGEKEKKGNEAISLEIQNSQGICAAL